MKEAGERRTPSLEELRAGDKQARERAFNDFIEPRREKLVGLAKKRLLGNAKSSAEDAVQDSLIAVWKRIPTMETDENLSGYLTTSVVSKSYNYGNASTKEQERVVYSDSEIDVIIKGKQSGESAEEMASKNDSFKELISTLKENMSEDFLKPLVMHEVEGYSGEEIAEMLNLNTATVRTRIHRGKKQAKKVLEKLGR